MIWTDERQEKALRACNTWRGVSYAHRVMIAGRGVDCINAVRVILIDSGVIDKRPIGFYNVRDGIFSPNEKLRSALMDVLWVEDVSDQPVEFGDICIGKTGEASAHVGFYARGNLWHAKAQTCFTRTPWQLAVHKIETRLRLTDVGWRSNPNRSWAKTREA